MLANLREFTFASAVLRLLLAMLSGGVVGFGRSQKERAAGFRTYMLISIGAAMAVLLTQFQYTMLTEPWSDIVEEVGMKYDGSRLAAAVITGIGFLGAGIIIKISHQQVNGLTTSTGLFATMVMGLAAGAGFYEGVCMALVLIVLLLNVMSPLEFAYKRRLRNITLNVEFNGVDDIVALPGPSRARAPGCTTSTWSAPSARTTSIPLRYSSSSWPARTIPTRPCCPRWPSCPACTQCRS